MKLKIDEAIRDEIDRRFDKLTEESDEAFQEELKSKYSTLEQLVAHPKRIDQAAAGTDLAGAGLIRCALRAD